MNVRSLLNQKASDIYVIEENQSLCECINMLNAKHVGALVVVNSAKKITGIISERDVLRKTYSSPTNVCALQIKDAMTPKAKLITATETDPIPKVMELMTENRIRHLPVMDGEKLIGIISIGDVVKGLLACTEEENQIMKDYITGKSL